MKRIFSILFLILILFCGCVITEREIETKDCFNNKKSVIKIVIPEYFSDYLEKKAIEFQKEKNDFAFEFLRVKDDQKYKDVVLEAVLNKDANMFYVHGGGDVSFFSDLIEPFNFVEKKRDVVHFNEHQSFRLDRNFCGIFVNLKLLKYFNIKESDLNSFENFLKIVKKIKEDSRGLKKENVLNVSSDLASIVCSLGFKKGEICDEFEKLFSFKLQDEKEIASNFLEDKILFFVGSSRFFDLNLFKNKEQNIKCLPIAIAKNNSIIVEDDLFCLTKNNTGQQKEVILEFLDFIAKSEKISLKQEGLNLRESEFKNVPYSFRDSLKTELFKLKEGKIDFKTLKENIKKNFEVFKKLEEISTG